MTFFDLIPLKSHIPFLFSLMADCWRHGVHREEELHPPRRACCKHTGQWHLALQDSRLWPGQDHRIRIHGSRRCSMHSDSHITVKWFYKYWGHDSNAPLNLFRQFKPKRKSLFFCNIWIFHIVFTELTVSPLQISEDLNATLKILQTI